MAKTVNKKQTIQLADGQFFVNPKEIFCGDKVVLKYQTVLTDDNAILLGNVLPIKITEPEQLAKIIKIESLDCTVENFEISISGNLLTSQINFVPWRLGKVSYPTVKLELESLIVELPGSEFTVSSILEATGETSVKPAMGPILLPGTTYTVYAGILLVIVFLSLVIFTLTKSSKIIRFFKNIIIARRYKKNYKKSLAMLKKLSKNSQNISYKEFAEELKKYTSVEIDFLDERLTSISAEKILISADVSRKKRKDVLDKLSATIILQDYLDQNNRKY